MDFPVILAFQAVRLVPDGTLFIHITLILLMIWILNRTLFRPINRIIKAREKNKGGYSGEAEEILNSVAEKRARYEAAMLEARSRGYELIEKERSEAVAKRQTEISAVKREVEQTLMREKSELERQSAEVKAVLAKEAEKMADKISSNILNAV